MGDQSWSTTSPYTACNAHGRGVKPHQIQALSLQNLGKNRIFQTEVEAQFLARFCTQFERNFKENLRFVVRYRLGVTWDREVESLTEFCELKLGYVFVVTKILRNIEKLEREKKRN